MILFNAAALHIPTIITFFGANSPNSSVWVDKFNIVERVQLAGFCVQEFVISTIYVYSTTRLLGSTYHNLSKKVMVELIIINCICIGMDIILICLEYTNQYIGEASMKPMIYAIKLKLEFTVLNQLVSIAGKGSLTEGQRWGGGPGNELKDRYAYNDLDRKSRLGTQTSARAVRYSTGPRPDGYLEANGILRVQQTEISSEPTPGAIPEERSESPATAAAYSIPKSQVRMPGRSHVTARSDLERKHSPSESQMEIIRNSSDTEKGTR